MAELDPGPHGGPMPELVPVRLELGGFGLDPTLLDDSVDRFDAAARLEAHGFSQRTARKHGYADVFQVAASALLGRSGQSASAKAQTGQVRAALARAALMLIGLILCLAMVHQDSPTALFLAGGWAWISSQVTSALVWWGRGRDRIPLASRLADAWAAAMLVAALGVAVTLGSPAVLGWTCWAVTAAIVLGAGRPGRALMVVGSLTGWAWLVVLVDPEAGRVVALVIAAALLAWATGRLLLDARPAVTAAALADLTWRSALGHALAQCLPLIVTMALISRARPVHFTSIALATMVAVSACEPLVEVAHLWVRRLAGRSYSWRETVARTRRVGVGVALVATAASLVVAQVCSLILAGRLMSLPTTCLTGALGAAVTGISLLLGDGDSRGAARLAMGSSVLISLSVLLVSRDADLGQGIFGALLLILTATVCLVAVRRLGSPRSW